MKIPTGQIDAFVAKPDPALRAVLVYGPDAGLVRERADRLARSVVEDLRDPFRIAELTAAQLRDDPARLGDEAAQIAMIGGRRVVRLRDATDNLAATLEGFLEAPAGDALIVIEAGDLPPRSKLRALFEGEKLAAAVPCYADSEEAIAGLVRETLRQAGLGATPDALDYLSANLGGDRLLTRRELEKLVLYMGPAKGSGAKQVRLEDVEACVGDSAAHSIDDAILAVADGDPRGAERALAQAFAEGESPVGAVRAAQRYFQRLHWAAGQVESGSTREGVAESVKPRLFWKVKPRFIRQLGFWSSAHVARALERLTTAEIECKTTGLPDEAMATDCFLKLAGGAERFKRRA